MRKIDLVLHIIITIITSIGTLSITNRLNSLRCSKKEITHTFLQLVMATKSTGNLATAISTITEQFACPVCGTNFCSRNAMYRYLRDEPIEISGPSCKEIATLQGLQVYPTNGFQKDESKRQTVIFKLAVNYHCDDWTSQLSQIFQSEHSKSSISVASGIEYRKSSFLIQDSKCLTMGDVVIVSYMTPASSLIGNTSNGNLQILPFLELFRRHNITVISVEHYPKALNIQAEQHCTARTYDFILPIEYLHPVLPLQDMIDNDTWRDPEVAHFDASLRFCLRALSSPKLATGGGFRFRRGQQQTELRDVHRWHNYYHHDNINIDSATLTSTQAAAQRSVDKFVVIGNTNSKYKWTYSRDGIRKRDFSTFRISGDGFLTGQIRAMIGVLVCVMQGWLPKEFIAFSQRPDVVIETPMAPSGLLFLSEVRYDWHSNKHRIFNHKDYPSFDRNVYKHADSNESTESDDAIEQDVESVESFHYYRSTMKKMSRSIVDVIVESEATKEAFITQWMHEMRTVVCPRIVAKMEAIQRSWNITDLVLREGINYEDFSAEKDPFIAVENSPLEYRKVLKLLIEADRSGLWPSTTSGRQKVINSKTGEYDIGGQKDQTGGSFSVGRPVLGQGTPRGNILFADLVEAVFELEAVLLPDRPASRMVAINRRATFLPHKDSGAGFGQSTSLIVGLGDYIGGELNIEGDIRDIRYKPVEFDGWNQMHWTMPFIGNRYSLVWFSPAEKDDSVTLP